MSDGILTKVEFSSQGLGSRAAVKARFSPSRQFPVNCQGFTLIEAMIVVAIIGILAAIAIPSMFHYIHMARVTKTIGDLKTIETALFDFNISNGRFPEDLHAVGYGNLTDSWGNPYAYTRVAGTPIGKLRKDKFLVPVNTDFDLYSMGRDGASVSPFTAAPSRDDIVRTNNGGYFGLVSMY